MLAKPKHLDRSRLSYFFGKIEVDEHGCWLWRAARSPHTGYAVFRGENAHRFAYRHFVAAIPAGWVVDHLCRNRACVNPAHLDAVTHATNVLRGNWARAACKRGHAWTPDNVKFQKNGSVSAFMCIECDRQRKREGAARRRLRDKELLSC